MKGLVREGIVAELEIRFYRGFNRSVRRSVLGALFTQALVPHIEGTHNEYQYDEQD